MTHYRMYDVGPSAIITVAGSERKIYQNGQIFLNDGEEFSIRFFNPLNVKIGVEIIFDGTMRSTGLLVLKPGEDVTLDRFLDNNRRMKFDTYTIDSSNEAAVRAIAQNGKIEINFYKEKTISRRVKCVKLKTKSDFTYYNSGSTGNLNNYYSGDNLTSTPIGADYKECLLDKSYCEYNKPFETGRVEIGSESLQKLETVNVEFESISFHSIVYWLKPTSQMSQSVAEIREYCTQCGYRIRKSSWRFCPKCGEKLD